jgi:THO complex subunit 2
VDRSFISIPILFLQTKSFVESSITAPRLLQERCEVSIVIVCTMHRISVGIRLKIKADTCFSFPPLMDSKEDFLWEVEQSKLKGQDLKSKEVCIIY